MSNNTDSLEPTRRSLLVRLKNLEDQASWFEFFNKYWRLIYTVARRAGLADADAQEVVQETILRVVKSIETYEYRPEQCPFRSWLLILTSQRIIEQLRKQQRELARRSRYAEMAAPSQTEQLPESSADFEEIWAEEWEKNLIHIATEQVKKQVSAKQFQIYDLHVLQNWEVKRVTTTLAISAAQVYLAKQRVGRLMRKAIEAIESRGQ